MIPENPTQFSTYYGQELITFKKISTEKLSKNDQKELKEKWGPKINGETGVVSSFFPKMVKFRAAPPGLHRRGQQLQPRRAPRSLNFFRFSRKIARESRATLALVARKFRANRTL